VRTPFLFLHSVAGRPSFILDAPRGNATQNAHPHWVYTRADIGLLAEVDEVHETLSGPATQKILYREYHEYGNHEYERLCRISVPHGYSYCS
jgi:hypothetical protein